MKNAITSASFCNYCKLCFTGRKHLKRLFQKFMGGLMQIYDPTFFATFAHYGQTVYYNC